MELKKNTMNSEMDWTGERLVTSLLNHFGVTEHLHRYAVALEICKNKDILDIASGEGYGSNLISEVANTVVGVDISVEAVKHASLKYTSKNLKFKIGSADKIPLQDDSIDVVVSFETIEHHDKHLEMFSEIKRVLKKDGILIMSSPEKSIYFERDPNNSFHIKELTTEEFLNLSKSFFKEIKLFKQRFIHASLLAPIDNEQLTRFQIYGGNYLNIENSLNEKGYFYNKPYFNVLIASDVKFEYDQISIFDGAEVLDKEAQFYKDKLDLLLKSTSYRLGAKIVKLFFKIPFINKK